MVGQRGLGRMQQVYINRRIENGQTTNVTCNLPGCARSFMEKIDKQYQGNISIRTDYKERGRRLQEALQREGTRRFTPLRIF